MADSEFFWNLEHGNRNITDLRQYCHRHITQILEYLPAQVRNAGVLNKLFTGLSDPAHPEYKIQVVDIVLQELRNTQMPLTRCGDIISRVCLEFPCLPATAVVKWCNDSVQSIVDDNDVNMIWRDVIPECLNAVKSVDSVTHDGSVITGSAYSADCLKKLLECQWKERQLDQITAMLKDMQLTSKEHRKFVTKICLYIRYMPPASIPSLVHHLLRLCKTNNMDVVLAHLSYYFNLHLFKKPSMLSRDSESTTMDFEDIENFSVAELNSCLSTCIYLMTEGASNLETLRKHLKARPRSQLSREPFALSLAVAMVDKGGEFKAVCLEVIRQTIEQEVIDDMRRKEWAWCRDVQTSNFESADLLKGIIIRVSQNHSDTRSDLQVWMGLIHLGVALLAARGPRARPLAAVGIATLTELAKAQPFTAPYVLSVLADRLAADGAQEQYAECLLVLCQRAPLSVQPCAKLGDILERCRPSPGAAAVFDAVHPLLNSSERLRDTLLMLCRKGLYSRDSAHRCMAVSGILTLLKHLRVRCTAAAGSQGPDDNFSPSPHSYLSVLTVDVHASQQGASGHSRASNRTTCLEMVSMLRRCLGQDANVRQLLYTNWYSCVKDKPSVHDGLLEMLSDHLGQYLSVDREPGLLIDKCVQTTSSGPVLIEPIGYLIYLIARLLDLPSVEYDIENIFGSENEENGFIRRKLKKALADLSKCDMLAQIDIENLKSSDASAESKAACIKVQQLLQVHEALIAHQVMQWNAASGNADIVYRLYKGHSQLYDNAKSPTKAAKKVSKLNETQDSVKSRKSQTSKSQKTPGHNGTPRKARGNPKVDKSGVFKPLPCLWNLKFCYRILELLYSENVQWSSLEQRNSLRGRGVVHGWVARSVAASLRRAHEPAHAREHLPRVAHLLYSRCVCRFQDLCDFDDDTAVGCLQLFCACLESFSLPKYKFNADTFLGEITGVKSVSKDDDKAAENKAAILTQVRLVLLEVEQAEVSQGAAAASRKIVRKLMDIIVTLLNIPTGFDITLSREIVKLENYVCETAQECVPLLAQLLATAAAESCEAALLEHLLRRLADVLAPARDDPTPQDSQDSVPLAWVRAGNAQVVLKHVYEHLLARLACAKHVLTRVRDLASARALAVHDDQKSIEDELVKMRSSCVLLLCQLARWVRALCALCVVAGAGAARRGAHYFKYCFALTSKLYAHATSLVKTLDAPGAREARLERLLELMGNPLTETVRDLLRASLGARLVGAVETFRAAVCRLDKGTDLEYQQYVSDRIEIQTGENSQGDADETAADESPASPDADETMDIDSDADI